MPNLQEARVVLLELFQGPRGRLQQELDPDRLLLRHPGRYADAHPTLPGLQGHRRPDHLREADGQGTQERRDARADHVHAALGVEAGVARAGQVPDAAARVAPQADPDHRLYFRISPICRAV